MPAAALALGPWRVTRRPPSRTRRLWSASRLAARQGTASTTTTASGRARPSRRPATMACSRWSATSRTTTGSGMGATGGEGFEGEAEPPLASPLVYTRGRLAPAPQGQESAGSGIRAGRCWGSVPGAPACPPFLPFRRSELVGDGVVAGGLWFPEFLQSYVYHKGGVVIEVLRFPALNASMVTGSVRSPLRGLAGRGASSRGPTWCDGCRPGPESTLPCRGRMGGHRP